MISKSLKVGDLFTDGDFEYKVVALGDIEGTYVSKLVGVAKPEEINVETQEEKPVKKIRKKVTE